jgi:hypothetical protein
MDIEAEKVVAEWNFVKDGVEVPMSDIVTDSKSSQMEDCKTFLGLDKHRLCRWDTRVARGVVQTTPVALEYAAGERDTFTTFTPLSLLQLSIHESVGGRR